MLGVGRRAKRWVVGAVVTSEKRDDERGRSSRAIEISVPAQVKVGKAE